MVSTTKYTVDSQIAEFSDGMGSYAYSYDDTPGESRRLLTGVTTDMATGPGTFTLAHDARGELSLLTYPNGTTARYDYDGAGNSTGLSYASSAGLELLQYSLENDVFGDVVAASSPAWDKTVYEYDALQRPTKATQANDAQCRVRTYGFDSASHRVASTSAASETGDCSDLAQTGGRTSTFDAAGRNTSAGYSYDGLGRTLTVPGIDTANPSGGGLEVSYFANGMVKSLGQSTADGATSSRVDYQLDATGRIDAVVEMANGVESARLRYRFSAPLDSPTSIQRSEDGGTSWITTRYVSIPGIGMVSSIVDGGYALHLTDAFGNVVASQGASSPGVESYQETDEFGNSVDATSTRRYGWQGSAMRSGDAVGGIMLMGVRMYNPATGAFLTRDPVRGGNATPYGYPEDPVNSADPSGACPVCIVIPIGIGIGELLGALAAATVIAGVTIYTVETVRTNGITIPMPNPKNKKVKARNWKVYTIYYLKPYSTWKVWKYGITGQQGDTRPKSQLGRCRRQMGTIEPCTFSWRATGLNRYYARLLEANLILTYVKKWGHCPPGHRGKICT